MPYGIFAFALVNLLPGIVVLAAIGSNVYWISLVVKLRALMGDERRASLPSNSRRKSKLANGGQTYVVRDLSGSWSWTALKPPAGLPSPCAW